ncbi:copper resistance protein NlpE [Luteimonas mephitis]|uniref:copper resistance protein NlpE n=1 Tax=Luteimonas mephitis TaxID=83615 RepID=UPI00146E90A8|nr:copper resistance protein NlpE [Luteimonas mephitis]
MTYRTAFTLGLCAAALALAACKPSSDTAAPADAMAPSEAVAPEAAHDTATDVLKEVDNSPAPEGLDVRAFAGSFKGTLPCADCPGIDSTIELKADGSYATHDVYQERDASFDSTGTWTVEEAGKRIRLDPNSKDEVDRLYEVVSNDELRMLDGDGKAIESGLDYSLHRSR